MGPNRHGNYVALITVNYLIFFQFFLYASKLVEIDLHGSSFEFGSNCPTDDWNSDAQNALTFSAGNL